MNKKIGVSILFGLLILVGVIVVTKFASSNPAVDVLDTDSTAIAAYGDGYNYDNTTKGGVSEIINLTVAYGLSGVRDEVVTNITVSWSGNFTFLNWFNKADGVENWTGILGDAAAANITFNNVTILSNGAVADWGCIWSADKSEYFSCHNTSEAVLGPGNTTLIIRFNATAASSLEDKNQWNVTVSTMNGTGSVDVNDVNTTNLNTYIDGLAPRLVELNITDGNVTYANGTFNGTSVSGYTTYLDANSVLTIDAWFYELTPDDGSMSLYYNGSEGSIMSVQENWLYGNLGSTKNATIVTSSCTHGTALVQDQAGDRPFTHNMVCSWTIPAKTAFSSGGTNLETIAFGLYVNDSLNQFTTINDTTMGGTLNPFSILTNETLPYVNYINVTDQNGNVLTTLDGTGYLNGQATIDLEVKGGPRATNSTVGTEKFGSVLLYYNENGELIIDKNGDVRNYSSVIEITDGTHNFTLDTVTNLKNPAYSSLYNISLLDTAGGAGNSTNIIRFAIVIGNTSLNLDNQNGNYTTTVGPYSFKIDTTAPNIEIERITDSPGITQYDSVGVEYKCTASDISGIQKYVWTLDKPGDGNDVVYDAVETSLTSNTKTFSSTTLDLLGEYVVKCMVYDSVDNYAEVKTTTSECFTVSASTAGGAVSGGAGGGAAAVRFDVDFTTANEGIIKAQQGRIKSFSFDGVTQHTITFVTVTASSATLKIESTPITVTLNIGETKSVDVNADGINDMNVKLNSIVNNVADVTIKKVEEGAAKVVEEEEATRGIGKEEGVTPPVEPVEKGKAATWLWVLVVLVVIIAAGYYFFKKKK